MQISPQSVFLRVQLIDQFLVQVMAWNQIGDTIGHSSEPMNQW